MVGGVVGAGNLLVRATQNLQKPQNRIPGIEPIGKQDLDAAKETYRFYKDALANPGESGPAALDAITELGPRASGRVLGEDAVVVTGAVDAGVGLVRGGARLAGKLTTNLREGAPTAGRVVEGASPVPRNPRCVDGSNGRLGEGSIQGGAETRAHARAGRSGAG